MNDNSLMWNDEWHQLVECERKGLLTPQQAIRLEELRHSMDAEAAPRVNAMRDEFARQDRMYEEALAAYQKSRPAAAAKSASNRK